MLLIRIILLTLLGSFASLAGAIFLVLSKKKWTHDFTLKITGYAAGVLLATAFLDLLPEALEEMEKSGGAAMIFMPVFLAIVLFFFLERTLLWFHHHHGAHDVKPTVWMITVGDSLHNFIDGVGIAAACMVNPVLGLTTALAVGAHEIPQEIADATVMLGEGLSKTKTIVFNILSALVSLLGAVAMFYFAAVFQQYLGFIIAFTGGMFMYISLSDLIPELHHAHGKDQSILHAFTFLGGILTVYIIKLFIQA